MSIVGMEQNVQRWIGWLQAIDANKWMDDVAKWRPAISLKSIGNMPDGHCHGDFRGSTVDGWHACEDVRM